MTAPTLTNLSTSVTFSKFMVNATPQLLDASVTFSDAEGDFDGATVTLGGYGTHYAEDQFGIRNEGVGAGLISVVGSNVSYSGVTIGSFTGGNNGQQLTILLNANATVEAVDALIENLTYGNTSGSPTAERDLYLNVRDAAGQDLGLIDSGYTQLQGTDNPFNSYGSAQMSFQVAPTLFDYDKDGDLDLFSGGDDGAVRAFQNNGGAFTQLTGSSNPFNGFDPGEGSAIAFIDIDGDGDRDAIITEGLDGGATKFTNNNNGTFTNAGALSGFYRGSEQNARPAAYDVDGDGDQDLVVGGRDGTLKVFRNNSDGTVTEIGTHPFTGISLGNGSFPAPTFGDIDGDGDLDLLLGNSNGYVITYMNNNNVFTRLDVASDPFAAQFDESYNLLGGVYVGQNATPVLGDIDGDTDLDLIVGSTYPSLSGHLDTFRNDGVAWGKPIHVTVSPKAFYDGTPGVDNFAAFTNDNWTIKGFESDDTLSGSGGNDFIGGGSGADTMTGGNGNDTYIVDQAGDKVIESSAAGGVDMVQASISYILGANVENLTLLGTAAINGTGNSLNNVMLGNSADNTLDGNGGADTMQGGLGNDIYVVDNSSDVIIEKIGEGTDQVKSSVDYALGSNLEKLQLVGSVSINATGNSIDNIINGNTGNNVIDGNGGADLMGGGLGDDTYVVDNAGDAVVENADAGTDLVKSSVNFTLSANVEKLQLIGAGAINGNGNGLNNIMNGNGAGNIIDGKGGADVINGNGGDDSLRGGLGADQLTGGTGADRFEFDSAFGSGNVDNISDFQTGVDKVVFDQTIFSGLTATGTLAASAFSAGTSAHDASDRIIYDSTTGKLYYDADGNGAGSQVLIAQLGAATALTNTDILVAP